MNTKALLFSAFSFIAFAFQSEAAVLVVTNGDFSNLTGLAAQADGWYAGVPAGWTGNNASTYSVYKTNSNYVANISTLYVHSTFTTLSQDVGVIDLAGDVTLTFDLPGSFGSGSVVYAAIYNAGTGKLITLNSFSTLGTHKLVASNVAAATSIRISFWYDGAGSPALDNVSISAVGVRQ